MTREKEVNFRNFSGGHVSSVEPAGQGVRPEFHLLYSQTYWGDPQKCTGLDQLLLARGPWEEEPILIRGIALTHRVYPPTEEAFAMAGSSAVDGDILAHVSGSGTAYIIYPERTGFLFPGRPVDCHLDVHAWCSRGKKHDVCLTIFYQKPVDPGLAPLAIPQPDNDKLAELARRHPVYRPVPPQVAFWRRSYGLRRRLADLVLFRGK
jgi:hypothetical protein